MRWNGSTIAGVIVASLALSHDRHSPWCDAFTVQPSRMSHLHHNGRQEILQQQQKKKGTSATRLNDKETDGIESEGGTATQWRRPDLFGSSMIEETIESLKSDEDYQGAQKLLRTIGLSGLGKEERTRRRRALTNLGVPSFAKFLTSQVGDGSNSSESGTEGTEPYVLKRKTSTIFQINIGLYCNQACGHCHVESSPLRTEEMMTAETAARCLDVLRNSPTVTTLDITGGAPELNANFRYLVRMARSLRPDLEIIDRCNLTVLQEPGQGDLLDFLKEQRVHIIASLPCYTQENVDAQRGKGVFERSIAALLALNDAGYGIGNGKGKEGDLQLDLVYNPGGAVLPGPQQDLEVAYKQQLADNFGVLFDHLFTITNMPIKRFADYLHRRKELQQYMDLLVQNFNPNTLAKLMCLDTVSVGWDGKIYDCDFNQQLGYAVGVDSIHKGGTTIFDIESLDDLSKIPIRTDNHCFGCTAGMGSSCQGATAS